MTITADEAKKLYVGSVKSHAEQLVLRRWYYCLMRTLKVQEALRSDEPDFSHFWIDCDSQLTIAVRDYRAHEDVDFDATRGHDEVVMFIHELIGDELSKYGLKLEAFRMRSGEVRIYILKPGQPPNFM